MEKLKKIAKVWGILALFMLVSSFMVDEKNQFFYWFFISLFVLSLLFILLGWDKFITYGEETSYGNDKPYTEDADDWLE